MVGPIALHRSIVLPQEMFYSMPEAIDRNSRRKYSVHMESKRRDLEEWEKAECAAFKAAFKAFNDSQPKGAKITQEAAGLALGMNQGSFSNYLNGHRALNKELAVGLYKLTGIPVESYSPRIAAEISAMAAATGEQPYQKDDKYLSTTPEHRQAVDELADKLLNLSPEQALKVKQAMELLMPANDTRKN